MSRLLLLDLNIQDETNNVTLSMSQIYLLENHLYKNIWNHTAVYNLFLRGGTIKLSPYKRRHDSISVKWKPVFFFCCRPSTRWPVMYKSKEREEASIMSESDTMFNERDRRCAAVQLMPSTDPSYDNRAIASTLKMDCHD